MQHIYFNHARIYRASGIFNQTLMSLGELLTEGGYLNWGIQSLIDPNTVGGDATYLEREGEDTIITHEYLPDLPPFRVNTQKLVKIVEAWWLITKDMPLRIDLTEHNGVFTFTTPEGKKVVVE